MYEIRNSQIHDAAAHRLRAIEAWLDLPTASDSEAGDRPGCEKFLGIFTVWHDRALGLVYGTSAGAWAGLVAYACAERASVEWSRANQWFPIALGALVAAVVYEEILRINKKTTGKIGKSKICPRTGGSDRTKTWSHTSVHCFRPEQSVSPAAWTARKPVGPRSAAPVRPFPLGDSSLTPRLPDPLLSHHLPSTRPRLHRLQSRDVSDRRLPCDVPPTRSHCGVGNGHTIAWTACPRR